MTSKVDSRMEQTPMPLDEAPQQSEAFSNSPVLQGSSHAKVAMPEWVYDLKGSAFTTYRIGGVLDKACLPDSQEALVMCLNAARQAGDTITVLGWGGNSIIASNGIRGLTVILRKLETIDVLSPTRLRFGAGVHLARAASTAHKHGLTGGEYMIGIPGTIGGAIRMNAGALGQETSQLVRDVTVYNLKTGVIETRDASALAFSYRKSSINPQNEIILSAELEFTPGDKTVIGEMMDRSVKFRKEHHPKEPNGGSVFKNPSPDMPVGRLMEELGAKGQWKEGAMMVSPLHGNFIVNMGGGTSVETLRLMRRMQLAMAEHYGVSTHPENLFLGDATAEEKELWAALNESHS